VSISYGKVDLRPNQKEIVLKFLNQPVKLREEFFQKRKNWDGTARRPGRKRMGLGAGRWPIARAHGRILGFYDNMNG